MAETDADTYDAKWICYIETLDDPKRLLLEVVEHFDLVPTDSYYRDLTDTLLEQCLELAIGACCPWATHQHVNGNGVLCSWTMTKYVTLHG